MKGNTVISLEILLGSQLFAQLFVNSLETSIPQQQTVCSMARGLSYIAASQNFHGMISPDGITSVLYKAQPTVCFELEPWANTKLICCGTLEPVCVSGGRQVEVRNSQPPGCLNLEAPKAAVRTIIAWLGFL